MFVQDFQYLGDGDEWRLTLASETELGRRNCGGAPWRYGCGNFNFAAYNSISHSSTRAETWLADSKTGRGLRRRGTDMLHAFR